MHARKIAVTEMGGGGGGHVEDAAWGRKCSTTTEGGEKAHGDGEESRWRVVLLKASASAPVGQV